MGIFRFNYDFFAHNSPVNPVWEGHIEHWKGTEISVLGTESNINNVIITHKNKKELWQPGSYNREVGCFNSEFDSWDSLSSKKNDCLSDTARSSLAWDRYRNYLHNATRTPARKDGFHMLQAFWQMQEQFAAFSWAHGLSITETASESRINDFTRRWLLEELSSMKNRNSSTLQVVSVDGSCFGGTELLESMREIAFTRV